jgi:hypothetical protein
MYNHVLDTQLEESINDINFILAKPGSKSNISMRAFGIKNKEPNNIKKLKKK